MLKCIYRLLFSSNSQYYSYFIRANLEGEIYGWKIDSDEHCHGSKRRNKNGKITKKDQSYKELSLTPKKLSEITVKPKVKDGKLLFDKNNKDHRYIVEEDIIP